MGILNYFALLVAFTMLAAPSNGQDLGSSPLFGLGKSAVSESAKLLEEVPSKLENLLEEAIDGKQYASNIECLGSLQVGINVGAIAANALPFSSVEIFEDDRGPVARFRMLINGEKFHTEVHCQDAVMVGSLVPWGPGKAEPQVMERPTLDAFAGMLFLLHAQGAFVHDETSPSASTGLESQPEVRSGTGDAEKEFDEELARDALRVAIQACWNIGSLSTDALRTSVTVSFMIVRDGRPDTSSIRLIGFEGGSEESAMQAYEAARRAIIRCGASGFNLPAEHYDTWRDQVFVFAPERMRLR